MPDGDGFQLLARLVEVDDSVPVIAATAFDDSEIRARALSEGFRAFVAKPLDASDFIAVVESVTIPNES